MQEDAIIKVGHVTHFFAKISVAVVELISPLSIGDHIIIKGPSTDFEQNVESIQIEGKSLQQVEGGQSIGLKIVQPAKEKDVVYKKL